MIKTLLGSVAAVVVAAVAVPATAAVTFTVTVGNILAVPGNNDFASPELAALGLTLYTTNGTITMSGQTTVTAEYLGSESGFTDTFTLGAISGNENNTNNFAAPVFLGAGTFNAATFLPVFSSSNPGSVVAIPGNDGFGIFLPTGFTGTTYTSSVLVFGYDDQISNVDDNHDDFIVRVSAVPEPATWALMIGGFAMVGFGMRRRNAIVAA